MPPSESVQHTDVGSVQRHDAAAYESFRQETTIRIVRFLGLATLAIGTAVVVLTYSFAPAPGPGPVGRVMALSGAITVVAGAFVAFVVPRSQVFRPWSVEAFAASLWGPQIAPFLLDASYRSLEEPWFYSIYAIPTTLSLIPFHSLSRRIAASVLTPAPCIVAFHWPIDSVLAHEWAPFPLLFFFVTAIGAAAVGEINQRNFRARFEGARKSERQAEELATLNTALESSNDQLATLIGTQELKIEEQTAEIRDFATRLVGNRERDRKAIARELHDDFGQILTALRIELDAMQREPTDVEPDVERRERLGVLIKRLFESLDRTLSNLRPQVLDDLGLVAALEWMTTTRAEAAGLTVQLNLDSVPSLTPEAELSLFRIAQEAVTNVQRHSQAGELRVNLFSDGSDVVLEVTDDGIGFDPQAVAQRHGLVGMQERARSIGATATIAGGDAGGTQVRVQLPVGGRA